MDRLNCAQTIGVFCVLCAMNTPILMAQSAGVGFNFTEFASCNTSHILCVNDATISGHKIHLTNNTDAHYKLTDYKTMGRVVYNQTIQLSSLASFTTDIRFAMKYYKRSPHDHGGDGIAFFMTSKEMATIAESADEDSGIPGNEGELSPKTFGVEFYCHYYLCSIYADAAGYLTYEGFNETDLDQPVNNGSLWNARIEYNDTEKYVQIFLSNASNAPLSQRDLAIAFDFDCSKYLPDNLVVGISASAEDSSQTHTVLSWSFHSQIKIGSSSTSFNTKTKAKKSSTKIIIVAAVTVGAVFCLGVVVIWGLLVVAKKRRLRRNIKEACEENEIEIDLIVDQGPHEEDEVEIDGMMIVDQGPCRYKLEDLKIGTNNFCETLKLGQGGFGDVYKAVLAETNKVVAVKRISERSKQGIKEFISEVSIVSRVRHRNLVQLFGWCHEKGQLLLVYEYMPNGSLDKHLFSKDDSPPLQWGHRYRIALEIACGLLYLHEEWDQCIVHRDVKSSNVMLDSNFNAKLGDFGLARMLERNSLFQTTIVAGTFGYLAPECVTTGRTSPQSDVYSFGAVALEIATGKKATDASLQEHNMRLVEWVWDLYGQGKVLEAAEGRLDGEFDKAEMEQLIGIGLWCSHPDPAERPKMSRVVKLLKLEAQLPQLPPALPVPTYAGVQGAKLIEVWPFIPDSFQEFPYVSSTSSTSIAAGTSGTTTQVFSSSNSGTPPMVVHFQKQV